MTKNAVIISLYSILMIAGGFIGHATADSIASLVMGLIAGMLLAFFAYGMFKSSLLSYFLSMGLTALLFCFFIYRFTLTWKFMPAGMMALISLIVFIACFGSKTKKSG